MNEFFIELAKGFENFPTILLVLIASPLGAFCSAYVISKTKRKSKDYVAETPKDFVQQVIVGWLVGAFCGSLVSPLLNVPAPTSSFMGGGLGYIWMYKQIQKSLKDNDNDNDKTGNQTPT